jgi:hypothetical protein
VGGTRCGGGAEGEVMTLEELAKWLDRQVGDAYDYGRDPMFRAAAAACRELRHKRGCWQPSAIELRDAGLDPDRRQITDAALSACKE